MTLDSVLNYTVAMTLAIFITGCQQQKTDLAKDEVVDEWESIEPAQNAQRTADPDVAHLALQLKPGDRFPLRKVVEQELNQPGPGGETNVIRTRLEVLFAISVVDRIDDRTKLNVRYQKVSYSEQVGGETNVYDSTRPPAQIPVSMQAYHDMVNDGFSFWLGAENQIVAIDGFKEFVERCLRNVPSEQRRHVALGIEAGSGQSGIANFVDNSIGLLPYGGDYRPGDTWERAHQIVRPVPMHLQNRYTIKDIDAATANIFVDGEITPSTTMTTVDEQGGVRVIVTGGKTEGSCSVFRDSGLPKQSHIEQNIDMIVLMENSPEFRQQKRIRTTIESFPINGSTKPAMISHGQSEPSMQYSQQPIQRTSFENR